MPSENLFKRSIISRLLVNPLIVIDKLILRGVCFPVMNENNSEDKAMTAGS